MGTRSLTKVYEKWEQEDEATPLVCIYRQYDGYPEGMGKDLEEFLTDLHVVNGIGYKNTERIANGGGCLTAQLIEHLKAGQVGNVYIYPIDKCLLKYHIQVSTFPVHIITFKDHCSFAVVYDDVVFIFLPAISAIDGVDIYITNLSCFQMFD